MNPILSHILLAYPFTYSAQSLLSTENSSSIGQILDLLHDTYLGLPEFAQGWLLALAFMIALLLVLSLGVALTNVKDESNATTKRLTSNVLLRVSVSACIYLIILIFGISAVLGGSVWASIEQFSHRPSFRSIILIGALWFFVIKLIIFLIKPLFKMKKNNDNNEDETTRIKITKDRAPKLFAIIEEAAKATGVEFPNKVYVSAYVNGANFIDSDSINFFKIKNDNLEVGLGLFFGMNTDELKAIIAHEFGHFKQSSMRLGPMIASVNRTLCNLKLNRLYRFVEKANLSLARKKEFEADKVSASAVGRDVAISALCKMEFIGQRFAAYDHWILKIAQEYAVKPTSYWNGYKLFMSIPDMVDDRSIEPETLITAKDFSRTVSQVVIKDPWTDYPPMKERIFRLSKGAATHEGYSKSPCLDLVPEEIWNEVSEVLLGTEESFSGIDTVSDEEYLRILTQEVTSNTIPVDLRPFFNRVLAPFNPYEVEYDTDKCPSPLTEPNELYIREFEQEKEDYNLMLNFKRGFFEVNKISYAGTVYTRKTVPTDAMLEHLKKIFPKAKRIDKQICQYTLSLSDDPEVVMDSYDNVFYARMIIDRLQKSLLAGRDEIKERIRSIKRIDKQQVAELKEILIAFKDEIGETIKDLEMARLYPIITVDEWNALRDAFRNKDWFWGESISSDEINELIAIPGRLVRLFEELENFSKKIITDTIKGIPPTTAKENSVTSLNAFPEEDEYDEEEDYEDEEPEEED